MQNNITFAVSDYIDQYPDSFEGENIIIEEQITNYETANTTSNPYYTYTAPVTGSYTLEVWGAQGGTYSSTYYGGKGGYSIGTVTLNEGDELYVYVGGQPTAYNTSASSGNTNAGGYNGGGSGRTYYYSSTYTYGLGGGGATDIRIGGTTYYDRIIVAGGGSGSTNGSTGYAGGGSQSAGYSSSYYATYTTAGTGGSFGVGGSSGGSYNYKYGAPGGGGGWYGGGAGTGASDSSTTYRKYSGGGSGFIWTSGTASNVPSGYSVGTEYYLTDAATYAGTTSFTSTSGGTETGHSGNGYARITLEATTIINATWIDVDTQIEKGTLTGNFIYNGYTITVTNATGETTYPIIPVETITISGDNALGLGAEKQLTATVSPENATYKDVTWSSSDENVVIVDEETGVVTGIGEGTATITATADEKTATYIITVLSFTITFLIAVGEVYTTKEKVGVVEYPEEAPTKDGYAFTGWYYDEECTNRAQEGDNLSQDTTLYAGWAVPYEDSEAITNKENGATISAHATIRDTLLKSYYVTKEVMSCEVLEKPYEAEGYLIMEIDSSNSLQVNVIMVAGAYVQNSNNGSGNIAIKINFVDGSYATDSFVFKNTACFVAGTKIKLKDGSEKAIEDITYEDELLVWDFDNGCLSSAKPLWIQKKRVATEYNYLKFENGSELKTINQHRIFNKEAGKFTYPMTDETPIGTTTITSDGSETKLISKEVVKETVDYYNVITDYHINLFANNILTSCRLSNLYEIKDMKYVKDGRELATREEYKNIPDKYFKGLRIAEQPREINRGNDIKFENTLEDYVNRLISNEKTFEE